MDSVRTQVVALTVAYDGTPFAGFARQPGLETVQGRLESALGIVLRRGVETVGAGRTDAGVHALGQVVSLGLAEEVDLERLRRSLDALTGDSISVIEARLARAGFSARFDATSREYRYRIATARTAPLFIGAVAWHQPKTLEIDTMRAAARALIGEHDFRSFCVAESAEGQRTVRRVDDIELTEGEAFGEPYLEVRVVGNAFLHSMVRVIVGTLVEVGRGRREPQWVADVLEARERSAAGPTAPAHGLTLHEVRYPPDVWE